MWKLKHLIRCTDICLNIQLFYLESSRYICLNIYRDIIHIYIYINCKTVLWVIFFIEDISYLYEHNIYLCRYSLLSRVMLSKTFIDKRTVTCLLCLMRNMHMENSGALSCYFSLDKIVFICLGHLLLNVECLYGDSTRLCLYNISGKVCYYCCAVSFYYAIHKPQFESLYI